MKINQLLSLIKTEEFIEVNIDNLQFYCGKIRGLEREIVGDLLIDSMRIDEDGFIVLEVKNEADN